MATCNTCGREFDWGFDSATGRWIPLEPITTHDDLERTFVDEDGTFRAEHRARHGDTSVNVTRLRKKVGPLEAQAAEAETRRKERNARARERRAIAREEAETG